jgi:hypothetical protein
VGCQNAHKNAILAVSGIDMEEGELSVDFDGREVIYSFGELDELVLAYATTIHKSQGSEYPARTAQNVHSGVSPYIAAKASRCRNGRRDTRISPRVAPVLGAQFEPASSREFAELAGEPHQRGRGGRELAGINDCRGLITCVR